jgi:hypothetical protein
MAFAGQKLRASNLTGVTANDHVLATDVSSGVAGQPVKASQVA